MSIRTRTTRFALTVATGGLALAAASVTVLEPGQLAMAVDAVSSDPAVEQVVTDTTPAAPGVLAPLTDAVPAPHASPQAGAAAVSVHLRQAGPVGHLLASVSVLAERPRPGVQGWVLAHPREVSGYALLAAGMLLLLTVTLAPRSWRATARAVALWASVVGALPLLASAVAVRAIDATTAPVARLVLVFIRALLPPLLGPAQVLAAAGVAGLVLLAVTSRTALARQHRRRLLPAPDPGEAAGPEPVVTAQVPVNPVTSDAFHPGIVGA